MTNSENKLQLLALHMTDGIGAVLMRQLISYFGCAQAVLTSNKTKLCKVPGISTILADKILSPININLAEKQFELANKKNIQIIGFQDAEYPQRLKRNYDAPALLFLQGKCSLNHPKTIAIVGTRNATEYGKNLTEKIVAGLQSQNVLVVSGLAYGIDIAAHKACLKYNVPTLAAMAGGVDWIYPAVHKKQAEQMIETGGLLSEQAIGVQPAQGGFPARNRIIAGLCDALIVVEAAAKGGALITAEYANNYHKEVFAVPGNIGVATSEGCNQLIRQNKAQIFTSAEELVEAMNWDLDTSIQQKPPVSDLDLSQFSQDEAQILSILKQKADIQIDELAWQSQLSMNKLASILLNLEFMGLVKSLPGKKYSLF